jgi:hypothetical protein
LTSVELGLVRIARPRRHGDCALGGHIRRPKSRSQVSKLMRAAAM